MEGCYRDSVRECYRGWEQLVMACYRAWEQLVMACYRGCL